MRDAVHRPECLHPGRRWSPRRRGTRGVVNAPLLSHGEGAVLVLVNNNPARRNALNAGFYAALGDALRGGRRGLCAQRLAGRPDRQDRRPAALHRLRHLGRDPAPGRHEGLEGDRGHQQGPDSPIFAVADYALEAGIFTAPPELVKAL